MAPTTTARLALLAALAAVPLAAQNTADRLIDFELEDQFGRVHSQRQYEGRLLLLIGGDKASSTFNPRWAKAIGNALTPIERAKVDSVGFADLRSVPFFLRGMIRKKFPVEKSKWTLLDWDGVFDDAYGLTRKQANVLIFGADGRLLHRSDGREVAAAKVDEIVRLIRVAIDDGSEAPAESGTN